VNPAATGVLLLHGLTGMPSEMRPIARALRRLGCTVEVPLLPGHGATHRELLATGWTDWLGGARRAADDLAAQCDTLVVAGLSMGALLATLLAAEDPRIRGIALLSPTLRYDGSSIPWTRWLLPLVQALPFAGRTLYWSERPPYGLQDKRLQRRVTCALDAARRGESTEYGLFRTYVGSIRELNRMIREVRRRAGAVRCPTLVLQSVEDTITSVRNATEICDRIGSAEKSVHWLSGCDHVITLDLRKHEVARAVSDFTMRVAGRDMRTRPLLDQVNHALEFAPRRRASSPDVPASECEHDPQDSAAPRQAEGLLR
jgi:carboxylesterase